MRIRHFNPYTEETEEGELVKVGGTHYQVIPDYNLLITVNWSKIDCDVIKENKEKEGE